MAGIVPPLWFAENALPRRRSVATIQTVKLDIPGLQAPCERSRVA